MKNPPSPKDFRIVSMLYKYAPSTVLEAYESALDRNDDKTAEQIIRIFAKLLGAKSSSPSRTKDKKVAAETFFRPSRPPADDQKPKVGDMVVCMATGRRARLIHIEGDLAVVKEQFGSYFVPYDTLYKTK